jgi:glycine dehydrogenase subunit 1
VRAPRYHAAHFKEFVVDFTDTGKPVSEINRALRERGIFGGHDLGAQLPDLAGCALYCVTEIHSQADIDRLVASLQEVLA